MIKFDTAAGPSMVSQAQSDTRLNELKNNKNSSEEGVEKAASGFEALLLHNMLKEMWKTSGTDDGLLGENSHQSQLFRDMFNQAIADEVAKGEGIGVKQFLKKELSKEATSALPASKKDTGIIG